MKIREVRVPGRYDTKLRQWGPSKNLFERYEVINVYDSGYGAKTIEIRGPTRIHILRSCVNHLTIIEPPKADGESATQKKVPLYFVSCFHGASKIKGAAFFAEIDGELVAYRSLGSSRVAPL